MIKDRIIANLIQEYQKVHGYDPDILALMFYREGMSINEINEVYGKIQPQAVDIEEVLIGALMLEQDAVLLVIDILEPESFYKDEHAIVFKAIRELASDQEPVDILTVTEKLRAMKKLEEVGGAHFVSELTSRVATAAHVEYHAKIIQQKYIQRILIGSSC